VTPSRAPEDSGPFDDRFAYRVTEKGMQALAEYQRANGQPDFTKARVSPATARALETEATKSASDAAERKPTNEVSASSPSAAATVAAGRSRTSA
jgi:hypothetical protein